MRIEYNFELRGVEVPRFSVEATEGPHKLFTLATLILNVLHEKERADVVFHSANPDEPHRKIAMFQDILASAPCETKLAYHEGDAGKLGGVYYRWLSIRSSGAGA
jgi:hypothetical protein